MSKMGRPTVLTEKRKPTSLYIDESLLKKIDAYVYAEKQTRGKYSRADFINEAAADFLKRKGGKHNDKQTEQI